MEKTTLRYSKLACALFAGIAVGQVQNVQAGASGVINGVGSGWAAVNMRSVTSNTNSVRTPSRSLPSASIAPAAGYTYTTNSPSGASTNSYARTKATSLGGWQTRLFAAVGDGVDGSAEFEDRLQIEPATCAELTVDTVINQEVITETSISGTIQVITKGSGGTALWLRGFEYTGDPNLLPEDDPNTTANETIEYLKVHGTWKFENLIAGPFDFGSNGGCPLLIPFTLNSTNIENLIIASDTMAKSVPFVISCPADVTFTCGQTVKFPAAQVTGGCGQITGQWSPEENYAFPIGKTPVTVTVTDENGDTATCTFNVEITDTAPPQAPALPTLTYNLCTTAPGGLPTPTASDACAGAITGTTTNAFPPTTSGTNVITWTFNDGNGNVATANQTVIVNGLTFKGFYPPINGTGGSCSSPLVTKTTTSSLPIKFDLKCGNSFITGGTPPVVRIQSYTNCVAGEEIVVADAVYQNDWHYNWNVAGRSGGTYKITIDMPDGSSQFVFVKLK
ncbi:MAG TPA: HYR domain-containing protein [Verrucomicrobiae bacterium]|nr:HYR domain-containing protein [Verrucomicrobiae bacterium]